MATKKGKRASKVDPNETNSQRFKRLATARVNKILSGLSQLGKLHGARYESTPEEVKKIFDAIGARAQAAFDALSKKGAAKSEGFTL